MSDTLAVNEIYLSLQGESTFAGLPCVFVRLTACNLRCSYCDTAYAFTEGTKRTLAEVRSEVQRLAKPFAKTPDEPTPDPSRQGNNPAAHGFQFPSFGGFPRLPLVELTGGEPLLQPNSLSLMKQL